MGCAPLGVSPSWPRDSAGLGRRDVPAELDLAAETALVVLRLVAELDVLVGAGHLLVDVAAAAAARMDRRDEDFLHRHDQEILLAFAGLARRQLGVLEVLARRAVLGEDRGGLVVQVGEDEIAGSRFASSGAAAGEAGSLGDAPAP